MGPVGGLGVAYFAVYYFFPFFISLGIIYKCLPRKTKEALKDFVNNIE